MKRVFDLFFTVPGIILLLPIFFFIALWIKLDSRGPVFYRQYRVGKGGRSFKIFKFRTMVRNAEQLGLPITVGEDPRITNSGRLLRRYKLDELPQLINVLLGEMSLVGPRPEVQKYVDMYDSEQKSVLDLLPGITDPASIKYRNENELLAEKHKAANLAADPEYTYVHEIMPDKIKINLEYARHANVVSDFATIIKTILG